MANIDPIIIDVGFKEDSSIQDVITHLSTVKEKMEDIGEGSNGSTAFLDQLGLSETGRQEIINSLSTAITGLSGIGENLTSIPAHLAQSFTVLKSEITGLETLLNNVNGKQKSLAQDSTKGMQSIQHMMMSVSGMSAQSKNIIDFSKAFNGATESSLGWSTADLARYAPQIVSMVLEPSVRKILAENKHGIGLNGIISSIMRDNNNVSYMQNIAKLAGVENGMSREQVQANYELMLRGYTPYAMSTGSAAQLLDWKARGVYETKPQALRVGDRFVKDSNDYQKLIFSGYGKNDYVDKQAAEYIRSQGGNPIRSYTARKQSGLQELHKFLKQGNNMDELFPLLQEAGIATVNNKGQYQIFNNIHEQQLQYLRARALQEYSNALRSDAPYEGNPTDVLSAGKMTNRQGRRPTLYLGLNNALPEEVIPSLVGFDRETMSGYGGKINTGISVGKTPTLSRYYIPQTSIDFGNGKAIVRSNFWQKDLSKGIDARPDDHQVAITDSLIARMFGMTGDRTLGFGHDEETGAIRRTKKVVGADGKTRDVEINPNMFTADFSKFVTYDDEKGKYVVDKTNPDYKRAERILSGQELVDYGGEKYRFLYSKDDGRAIFGKESIAQEIEARYAKAHLPSPFNYGNDRENGILFEDNAKTIKQINAMAKMASSGTAIEDLMSPQQAERLKNATGIYANFEMMYDILDQMEKESGGKYTGKWSKTMGRRMDGLAFGDPTIFSRDFQGRFGSGTDKFAMGAYDWRPMLLAGWEAGHKLNPRLYGYDTDVTGMTEEEKKQHRAVFAPTGGAGKEDIAKIRQYISGKNEKGEDLSSEELAELNRQYFTNTVAKDAGYIIDRTASKSGMGYRSMSLKNFWDGKEGLFTQKDYDEALAEGRIQNGEVRLLPWQQEYYRRRYAAEAMPGKSGFIEMKNEGDMLSDKDFIPESVLRGVNAPQEVFEKSERLYKQRLDELNTTAGRIKQFQGDANAMEAIANDPSWVWNDHTAITHIEQTRRALEARRARHEVLTEGNREGTIAVGTVGQLAEIFQAMTGMSDKDYGEFQTLLPSFMEGKNAVFSKGVSSSVIDMLTRFPFASGQYMMDVKNYAQMFEGEGNNQVNIIDDYIDSIEKLKSTRNQLGTLRRRNTRKPVTERTEKIAELERDEADLQTKVAGYQDRIKNGTSDADVALKMADALRKSGRDPRTITSMMMTAGQIYSMNTGDFDGDTVNAFIGMSEAFKQNARIELNRVRPEIQRQREDALLQTGAETPEESPFLSKGEGVMEAWARSATATQKMAVASAALRKAQSGDPNDPTRVIALAEAMQAYDLATSDVKTKGAEFNLGSYAEKYLYSQGAHYERFIKQLQDNSADGTSTDRGGLFRFSAASTLDPEGVFAMSARHSNAAFKKDENGQMHAGIFDLDSYEKMESWYRTNFGAENTEESRAARFYLDKMEDNIIWGKLWNQKDIDKGNKLIQTWGSSLNARQQAGQNVTEERARYEDFRKRMSEMVDERGIAGTEENVRNLAERYERMAKDETDETKSKGYSLYAENLRRMLPENESEEERNTREAFIQTKKHSDYVWSKKISALTEDSANQENLDKLIQNTRIGNIVTLAKGEGNRSIYNWSNAKHFIGADQKNGKLYLDGLQKIDLNTGNTTALPAQSVDYYKNADTLNKHMRDMILEASGEKDRTEAYRNPMTHIGQLMHSTFERIKTPQEVSVYKTAEEAEAAGLQWMREALLGKTDRDTTDHDMAALRGLGLSFIEGENGKLKAINYGNKNRFSSKELTDYSAIVNNLLGTSTGSGERSKGFMQRQLDMLRANEASKGEEVLSIEDKLYRNGQQVSNDFGGRIYRRIVTDKDGNIVSSESSLDKDFGYKLKEGEKEHIYETHAKPDYVTRQNVADENGMHGLHVYDWKSSDKGALESIPQSMFYANMFAELGKKFYETNDQRYEQFKEWYDPKAGRSTVKMITGVNPQGGGENYNFDATTEAGRAKIAEIAKKVDSGMLIEERLGLAGFEQAWPYLSRISDKREEIGETVKSARQMIANGEVPTSGSTEMDFFLSTYGQNKERLQQLRADVFKEHNKDTMNEYIPQDRFTKREQELKEMFSQQEVAAVIANAGDSEMINSEIQKIQDTRAELLALNENDALKAASGDISQAKTNIRQMLTGIKPSGESNVVFGAVNALRRAAQTKEYLKADKQYVDANGNFKVNDENSAIKEVAKARSEAYEQAVKDEQEANEFLANNLVDYTSKYEKRSNDKINQLTRTKPLDPVESFQKFIENKQDELQRLIDQYNENVKKYDEEIKNSKDFRTKASLQRLRDIDKGNAERLQEFVESGGATEQTIQEQRKRLGLDTETPEQQTERWLNERLAVIKTQKEAALDKWFEGTGSKADYEKALQEERVLRDQSSGMRERLNRQREDQISDYQNTLKGEQLTPAEQAKRKINNLRDQITERRDRLGLNDPLRARYDAILNDKNAWRVAQNRTEEEILNSRELQQHQSNFRVDQLLRQGQQMDRNYYGQRNDFIGRALNRRDQLVSSRQNYKSQVDTQLATEEKKFRGMKAGDKGYEETANHIRSLKAASQEAGQAIEQLSGPMGTAGAIAAQLGNTFGMLAQRLGRQMFTKAAQEAKRFVQDFSKTMTSIQMITLKTDAQMSTLGDGLISKAKELKISISDITKSAETLYRQGLSDEEVDNRLDVISKFSKVSGTKVDAATKLITVAMNTGLVRDPQFAADVVTAFGDNAATNASEIEKGIEKAGAAAAADGTSFGELAAMLTAITSTTQIGGNVAGRTLNTIFGRMNKIGTNELIYDENGNAVSGSAVAKMLQTQGISMYDEKGNKHSSYDTLYALSQQWENMSDAEQQQIANAIAGTRQYSNFSAIMQGMSEGKVDEYMELVGTSSGITDQKYEIYTKSLEASLTNLKNTFDELVHDLTSNGSLTGVIDIISGIIKGIDNLTNSIGGLGAALVTVLPMLIGLTMLKAGLSTANIGLMAGGLGIVAAGGIIASANSTSYKAPAQTLETRKANYSEVKSSRNSIINRAEELNAKGSNRTEAENTEFKNIMSQLSMFTGLNVDFDDISKSTNDAASSAIELADALKDGASATSSFTDVITAAKNKVKDEEAQEISGRAGDTAVAIAEGIREYNNNYPVGGIEAFPEIFTINQDNASGITVTPSKIQEGVEPQTSDKSGYFDRGINFFLRQSKAVDKGFGGAENGLTPIANGASQFLTTALGKPVNGDTSSVYALNKKSYEENKNSLAEMFAAYTIMLGKDSGSQYSGWGKNDWLYEIERVANGESTIDDKFLEDYSKFYVEQHAGNAPYLNQRAQVEKLFRENLSGEVEPELLDAIVNRAVDEYYQQTPLLDPYSLPEVNDSAIGRIIKEIHGESKKAEDLEASHRAYAGVSTDNITGEALYNGEVYKTAELAQAQLNSDLEEFKKNNPVEFSPAYTETSYKGQVMDKEDAEDLQRTEYLNNIRYSAITSAQKEGVLDELKENAAEAGDDWITYVEDWYNGQNPNLWGNWIKQNPIEKIEWDAAYKYNNVAYDATPEGKRKAEKEQENDFYKESDRKITPVTNEVADRLNPFMAGTDTGIYNWEHDKQNAYALRADKMRRALEDAGVEDIDSLENYLVENGTVDWAYLNENNGEFARLVSSVQRDNEGNVINPEVFDQIIDYLRSKGRDLGSPVRSSAQKAFMAQSMFDNLIGNELDEQGNIVEGYLSIDEANEAAQRQYEEESKAYEERIKELTEQRLSTLEGQVDERDRAKYEAEIREANPYTGQTAEQIAAGYRVFTDEEKKYLQETVGEQLYSRLIDNTANNEDIEYAQRLLTNRAVGINGLTTSDRLAGIKEVRDEFEKTGNLGNYDIDIAKQYLSGWANVDEYIGLLNKENLTDDDVERLRVLESSLNEFQKNAQIKFDIEGIQTLEEAGELLTGTANLIEQLKKDGSFKIKAELELTNQAYDNSQIGAKLKNGTQSEQVEALKALGYNDTQIQKDFPGILNQGLKFYDQTIASQQAGTFDEWYRAAKTSGEAEQVERYANSLGYYLNDQRKFERRTYTNVDHENLLFGLERSKTPYEIEQAQRMILRGATPDSFNDNELYQQAFNGLTQNQKDYLSMQSRMSEIDEQYAGNTDYSIEDQAFIDRYNAMRTAAYADFGYKTRDEIYNAASLYNPITNPQFYNDYAAVVGSDIAERKADQDYTLTAPEEWYENLRLQRYREGYNDITQTDKLRGAQMMMQSLQNGTYERDYKNASTDMLDSIKNAVPELQAYLDALKDTNKSEEELKKLAEDANSAIAGGLAESKGYGDAAKKANEYAKAIAKGGTAATKANRALDAQMKSIQDQQTALEKAAGKSGKQLKSMAKSGDRTLDIFSGMFDYSPDQIANMGVDKIQELIDEAGPMIAEQFNDIVNGLYDALPDSVDVNLPISDMIHVNADGSVDLSDLEATLGATAAQIIGEILSLAREYGRIDLEAELQNHSLTVQGLFKAIGKAGVKSGGGYSGGKSGGGGGGGKSATDKLLEKQKQRISEIEHQSKMLEIQEKYLDFTNDYDNYSSNIDQQIANQERLRSAYAQSIQELKNQLATLERGSDDWNKANEQLMQYEENLENIKNTINDLGAKRITIVEQKQENEDKRGSHNLNMLSKMAARYQKSGQFESYEGIMEQTIEETRKQIHLNDKQITEWENLLKTFTENSDSWIQTRDKIWAMREENAELQNQMASDLIDLQEARISQIAEDLQNQKAPLEHRANMLDTYGQMYESVNDFTKYRGTLEGTIDTNRQMKEMTDAAIAQVKKQIDGMKESDPARQSAIQTLYELEEASAQYEASILSNQQAIEESLISELTQAHQDSGSILEHELKLLSEAEKEFIRNDDFVNYENILEEKARNASDRLKDQQNALEDYIALQNSGKITEGGQQWRELEDTIKSTKENIASLKNEWQEALQAIEKAKFTNLKETFAETYDLSTHQQKLVQYEQTRYQNNGQLTNYGTTLEWEGKILEEQRDSIQNHIIDLKEQLKESKEFPELYKEITKEIMTWEEKLADTNNRIEKNTELIEKNQEAIRKARIAVENEADKAIRAWIQKQRNMLSATVTMQNNIFAVISKNYQQQWALEQKTLDKKKQALNEEKNLINERVNFRKKMMDQEAKDEELAEYRRQLTLISQDTTRTKEANELRRKIQEMEKEQAMQNAQDVANAEIQSLNDQSKAIDDYAATYQENLTELLSNINNFKDIIDGLLSGSFEDFVNWNAEYNEDFKKSSDEQRQQLINGWEDTWYTMLGQLRTYWDQVDESMQSRDGFLELLKTQDEYIKLSETGQASYLYRAGELWDAFDATKANDATLSDNHEIIDTINDLKDWTFNVNIAGLGNYDFGGSISDYVYNRDRSVIPYEYDSDYKGVGYVAPPPAPAPAPTPSSGGGGSGNSGSSSPAPAKKKWAYSYTFNGQKRAERTESYSADTARKFAEAEIVSAANYLAKNSTPGMAETIRRQQVAAMNTIKVWQYKKGGLVDYTGLAMVHGTPQKPEAFLNAEDRANIRAMLDAFNYVKAPTMTHIDPSMYGTTTNNYGDVNITINEAKIDNDQDISALAQKIGKEFTKELSKSGFNTASYAW